MLLVQFHQLRDKLRYRLIIIRALLLSPFLLLRPMLLHLLLFSFSVRIFAWRTMNMLRKHYTDKMRFLRN